MNRMKVRRASACQCSTPRSNLEQRPEKGEGLFTNIIALWMAVDAARGIHIVCEVSASSDVDWSDVRSARGVQKPRKDTGNTPRCRVVHFITTSDIAGILVGVRNSEVLVTYQQPHVQPHGAVRKHDGIRRVMNAKVIEFIDTAQKGGRIYQG
ncbi:uncharacterized protein BT62DRAFT_259250 [Guyanagaster necrorhizus]|uniref:Uncharacterized protein n=1 Tax=Guyanagaster necrorhizus TaxID=856835 RepID=A0A9P7VQN2_9AGAR|nr:uncharacterized protein BT62DRAFT_259250 [Guyanagaster necrorhizus MCA 3950]KAG7444209.1 hypothetical protein BT62DRAFT_259250 [Guyanagaster necrorhizus MCA 3950]